MRHRQERAQKLMEAVKEFVNIGQLCRVSKTQREHIGRLADKCDMTISDYVLARSYNYRPKTRLTSWKEAVRDELIIARSDYAKYTSMLNAMPQDERRAMFRNHTWMVGALQLLAGQLKRLQKSLTVILHRTGFRKVPKYKNRQKQKKRHDRQGRIYKPRDKRPPIHHRRVEEQATSRTDISCQG